jgi:CYTH domain
MYSLVNNGFRYAALIAVPLFVSSAHGQETCSEEVKVLLLPTQVQAAVPSLRARGETHGRVDFYDTPGLDLLSKGVILRLREREEIDITTKLRPVSGEKIVNPSGGRERYECEIDLNDGVEAPSYSVQAKYVALKAPETGEGLFQVLTGGQKKLLEESGVPIDWKRVKRFAAIRLTSWKARGEAPLGKLSLELWEWPGGSVLEVSAKVATDEGQAAYRELRELAKKNGLALSADQRSKTAIALRAINGGH